MRGERSHLFYACPAVVCFTDHLHVALTSDQCNNPCTHDVVIVNNYNAQL
jgi:hypothetical protein